MFKTYYILKKGSVVFATMFCQFFDQIVGKFFGQVVDKVLTKKSQGQQQKNRREK